MLLFKESHRNISPSFSIKMLLVVLCWDPSVVPELASSCLWVSLWKTGCSGKSSCHFKLKRFGAMLRVLVRIGNITWVLHDVDRGHEPQEWRAQKIRGQDGGRGSVWRVSRFIQFTFLIPVYVYLLWRKLISFIGGRNSKEMQQQNNDCKYQREEARLRRTSCSLHTKRG